MVSIRQPRLSVVVLLCVSVAAVAAGQEPGRSQRPLTSGAAAIVVDAVVRDGKGKPVTDLGKDDFVLLEDGVPQVIGDVTVVGAGPRSRRETLGDAGTQLSPKPGLAADKPPIAPSFMAIVFSRLSPEARGRAYQGALACLDTLRQGDIVAVYVTDDSLITIQAYTSDFEEVKKALTEAARRAAWTSPPSLFSDWDAPAARVEVTTASAWQGLDRGKAGYATTDALLAITTGLGRASGRKTVVLFSEGIPVPEAVLPHFMDVIANANRGNVSVYAIDAAGLRIQSQQAEAAVQVRAAGAADKPLDAEGANTSSLALMERVADALRTPSTVLTMLTRGTGGFLVENTNDLAGAFRRVDADRRFHYLLTYTPTNSSQDGTWRNITVQVPARMLDIRARSGYVAVRSTPGLPLLAYEGPALAALDRSPAPTALPLRAAALVFPDAGGSRVAVLASTDGSALRFDRDDKTLTYRSDFSILARISDAQGQVVRKASQPYRLSGPVQRLAEARGGEVLFFRQPVLAAGSYTLEVAVHDALANRSGVHKSTFVVPGNTPLQVSSLVVVHRTERVKPDEQDKSNPLYAGDVLVYPNLGEPLRPSGDHAFQFYVTVRPGVGAAPQGFVEVLRDEQVVGVTPIALSAADASGRIAQIAQVSVERLPPGRYALRLTVTQAGAREVRNATFELVK